MKQFRFICPDCFAVVMATSADGLMWERCPACRRHIWDPYDALMADIVNRGESNLAHSIIHAIN